MKYLTYFVVSAILLSCKSLKASNSAVAKVSLESIIGAQSPDRMSGQIPGDLEYFGIVNSPGQHTWRDLNAYYRTEFKLNNQKVKDY
ncbi:MAG TPA: hypothetical protein VI603_06475 [Saprospiraceae bacterium]|nr:hypothetical protein [Saprospiraceae bacterium]